jgi:hypothetical protein
MISRHPADSFWPYIGDRGFTKQLTALSCSMSLALCTRIDVHRSHLAMLARNRPDGREHMMVHLISVSFFKYKFRLLRREHYMLASATSRRVVYGPAAAVRFIFF